VGKKGSGRKRNRLWITRFIARAHAMLGAKLLLRYLFQIESETLRLLVVYMLIVLSEDHLLVEVCTRR